MKSGEKILRKAFVYFMIVVILIVACIVVYLLKGIEDDAPDEEECAQLGVTGDEDLEFAI